MRVLAYAGRSDETYLLSYFTPFLPLLFVTEKEYIPRTTTQGGDSGDRPQTDGQLPAVVVRGRRKLTDAIPHFLVLSPFYLLLSFYFSLFILSSYSAI